MADGISSPCSETASIRQHILGYAIEMKYRGGGQYFMEIYECVSEKKLNSS